MPSLFGETNASIIQNRRITGQPEQAQAGDSYNNSNQVDLSDWDLLMASIDDMSSNELIRWIGNHHELASVNSSVLDTLLTNKINKENVADEREYNSMKNVMARLKEAGVNPALAFRTGENPVSFSTSRSNISNQFAREESLEESARKTNISSIFSTLGAIGGFIALLVALL